MVSSRFVCVTNPNVANRQLPLQGHGALAGPNKVIATRADGTSDEISTKYVLIATGSDVTPFPGGAIKIDEETIVSYFDFNRNKSLFIMIT